MSSAENRCDCGNNVNDNGTQCDYCEIAANEPPHTFRYSALGTTLWCVTCDSPLCDLL